MSRSIEGQDALGLFEDDAAVEGVLELLVDEVPVCGGSVLDEGDRRDVCPRLERAGGLRR